MAADGDAAVCRLCQSEERKEIPAIQKNSKWNPSIQRVTTTECIRHVCQASRTPRLLLILHLMAATICRLTGVHSAGATAEKHCSSTTRCDGMVLLLVLSLGESLIDGASMRDGLFFPHSNFSATPIPTRPRRPPCRHRATCHARSPSSSLKVPRLIVPPVAAFNYSLGVGTQVVAADASSITRKFSRAAPPPFPAGGGAIKIWEALQ